MIIYSENRVSLGQSSRANNSLKWGQAASFLRPFDLNSSIREADRDRGSHRERGDNLFPRCALIGGLRKTNNAVSWDAKVTQWLTLLSL